MSEIDEQSVKDVERSSMSKGKVFLFAFILLILIFLLIGGGTAAYVYWNLKPVEASEKQVRITIPSGASTPKIAGILKDNHLIRNEQIFTYYVRYKNIGNRLQAGNYEFNKGMTIDSILNKMASGEVVQKEMVKFTIPEGFKVNQIAAKLEKEGVIDQKSFIEEVQNGVFDYDFLKNIPNSDIRKNRLEGFLFPKTYEIPKDELNAHTIIDRMLSQFNQEFTVAFRNSLQEQGVDFYDAIILASIVERESTVDHERAKIAGVLNNRLEVDMLLQMDSTIQYIFDEQKDIVTYDDLEIEDPYNTYKYVGLPPGPIANPGMASLQAVVNPEKHDFLYFVTKKDGSGEHLFAKNFTEHVKNKRESEKQ